MAHSTSCWAHSPATFRLFGFAAHLFLLWATLLLQVYSRFTMSLQQIFYLLLWCQLCILVCVKKQKECYDRNIFSLSLPSFFLLWCVYTPFYRVCKTCSFNNSRGKDHIRNVPDPLVSSNRCIHWRWQGNLLCQTFSKILFKGERSSSLSSMYSTWKIPAQNFLSLRQEDTEVGSLIRNHTAARRINKRPGRCNSVRKEDPPFSCQHGKRTLHLDVNSRMLYIYTKTVLSRNKGNIFREMVNIRDFSFLCLANQTVVNQYLYWDKTLILAFKKRKRLKGLMRFQLWVAMMINAKQVCSLMALRKALHNPLQWCGQNLKTPIE